MFISLVFAFISGLLANYAFSFFGVLFKKRGYLFYEKRFGFHGSYLWEKTIIWNPTFTSIKKEEVDRKFEIKDASNHMVWEYTDPQLSKVLKTEDGHTSFSFTTFPAKSGVIVDYKKIEELLVSGSISKRSPQNFSLHLLNLAPLYTFFSFFIYFVVSAILLFLIYLLSDHIYRGVLLKLFIAIWLLSLSFAGGPSVETAKRLITFIFGMPKRLREHLEDGSISCKC